MFKNLKHKITISHFFVFSLICHLIAVYFTEGFHRPDEHLGVINMMGFKLGIIPQSDLSWEYAAQIRTWLQPFIYFVISKFYFLFDHNPFYLAFILRLFSSALGLYSLYILSKNSHLFIKNEKINMLFKMTIFSFWFFPFFHARTTTENFSTSFLILGLVPLFQFYFLQVREQELKNGMLSGFLLGLSFIFRFQSALAFAAPVLLTINKKISRNTFFLTTCIVFLITITLNVLIDYLGHGAFSFTAWNYLYQNIFLKVASGFGVSPWYYYINKVILESGLPLGLILLLGPIFLLIFYPTNLCNYIIWPFFIIHSIIGHKELRFIFPLLPFALLSIFCLIEEKYEILINIFSKKIFKIFIYLCFLFNFLLLSLSIFRPAFGPIKMYKFMYYSGEDIKTVYTLGVFRDQLRFYLKESFNQIEVDLNQSIKLIESNKQNNTSLWFLCDKQADREAIMKQSSCKEMYTSYPRWVLNFDYFNWTKRSKIWSLIKCQ